MRKTKLSLSWHWSPWYQMDRKGFFKCINSKRPKKKIGLKLVVDGHVTSKNKKKAEGKEDHVWGSCDFPFAVTEIVRERQYQLNVPKSMGPDGIHPQVLKELVNVIAGSLLTNRQKSWETREVPAYWKLASVVSMHMKGTWADPGIDSPWRCYKDCPG